MANKKDFTIEELKKMYENSLKESNTLGEMLRHKEKEEIDRKKAELELQKEKRMEEITAAEKHLNELYKSYIEDYGYLKIEHKTDDYDWFPSFWKHNFWF